MRQCQIRVRFECRGVQFFKVLKPVKPVEPGDSLQNIFYRSVRYAVLKARHTRTPLDLTALTGLVFDELERKPTSSLEKPKALHQNRQIVFAFLGQEPEGRPLFAFFAKADSHHHVCLDGVAISTIVVAGVRGGRI